MKTIVWLILSLWMLRGAPASVDGGETGLQQFQ